MNLSTSEFDSDFDLAKNYLLHRLDETAHEQVTYRLLDEPDFEQVLDAAAEELLLDYAQEALPDDDKIALEQHYLIVPEHRTQMVQLRQFQATLATMPLSRPALKRAEANRAAPDTSQPVSFVTPPPSGNGWRIGSYAIRRMPVYAALLLLILAAGCALTWHFRRAAQAEALLTRINQEAENYLAQRPQDFATATLKPVARGESSQTIKDYPPRLSDGSKHLAAESKASQAGGNSLPPAVSLGAVPYLLLRVTAPEGTYQSYDVTARRSDNSIRLIRHNLRLSTTNDTRQVIAVFPVAELTAGDYQIILDGVTPDGLSKNLCKSTLRLYP